MKKQINVIVPLTPAPGQNDVVVPFTLEAGFIKSMVVVSRGNENIDPSKKPLIFIGLKDDMQNQIVPLLPIDLYKQSGGNYENSFKPLNFDTPRKTYVLTMNTEQQSVGEITKDIQVFAVFNYDTNVK